MIISCTRVFMHDKLFQSLSSHVPLFFVALYFITVAFEELCLRFQYYIISWCRPLLAFSFTSSVSYGPLQWYRMAKGDGVKQSLPRANAHHMLDCIWNLRAIILPPCYYFFYLLPLERTRQSIILLGIHHTIGRPFSSKESANESIVEWSVHLNGPWTKIWALLFSYLKKKKSHHMNFY